MKRTILRQLGAFVPIILFVIFGSTAIRAVTVPRHYVDVMLNGQAAQRHMETLWNSTPQRKAAHDAAVAWLVARGYQPTNQYTARVSQLHETAVQRFP